jgi:DNA-binding PadR family transcriptional regulator
VSTRLVILGLLRDNPLYGYEIKQIIEDHMGDWTNIAFGSIYFALGKLTEERFIEKVGAEQEGRRPSRTVYRITETGREEFMRLLRETWREGERQYFTFDVGLAFGEALPVEEMISYLRGRVAQLESALHHLTVHREETLVTEGTPRFASAIFEHTRRHLEAELAWTQDLLDKVRRGEHP